MLDSRADISVFPDRFGNAGTESSGVGQNIRTLKGMQLASICVRKMDLELECGSQSGPLEG